LNKHEEFVEAQRKSKPLIEAMKSKRYQIEVEILGKKKFVYLNDLKDLDQIMKEIGGKVITVIEIQKEKSKRRSNE